MKIYSIAIVLAGAIALGCGSKTEEPAASPSAGGDKTATPAPSGSPAASTGTGYAAVQTILTANCAPCHGGPQPKGGINLTSYDTIMKGGEEGPVVTAGDPDKSVIIMALKGQGGKRQMPPRGGPLPAADVKTIEDWIKAGAKNG